MRIAVLGGSFNPLHIGHLALADDVRARFGYDRVLLVPTSVPPHKALAYGATETDRLTMLRLACAGESWLVVDDCEIERGGVSYTIDTLVDLEKRYRKTLEGKIGFVMGQDLVPGFSAWKEADRVAGMADLILALRPGCENAVFDRPHLALENPPLPVSSSEIRRRIGEGKSWRYLVPDPVYRYIVEHGLYEQR